MCFSHYLTLSLSLSLSISLSLSPFLYIYISECVCMCVFNCRYTCVNTCMKMYVNLKHIVCEILSLIDNYLNKTMQSHNLFSFSIAYQILCVI